MAVAVRLHTARTSPQYHRRAARAGRRCAAMADKARAHKAGGVRHAQGRSIAPCRCRVAGESWVGGGATILEMLNDPDPRVRQAAAIACGMTRDPSAFDSLVQRLGDSDEFVQAAAATALAGYGPRAITPLLELGKHAGPNLAWSLPLALGKAAGPRAVPLLLQLHASGLGVISGEYDALVECGNDAAFAALSEMVRRYGDPFAIGAPGATT